MLDREAIKARAQIVLEQVHAAERAAGRAHGSVTLVAVSKRQPAEAVSAAYNAGLRYFGENYVQELTAKVEALQALQGLQWHHIGQLQRNKAKAVVQAAALIHGVDRAGLVTALGRAAAEAGRRVGILLQINQGDEASKGGCPPQALGELIAVARAEPAVELRGLMTIPPPTDSREQARGYFAQLRQLRDAHGGSAQLPELSMGMSADYETAIAEGATLVRVGTAIFGERA